MDIKDRVALVTGGAIGIGRAIALALAGAGAEVVVCDINAAGVKETASMAPAGRCQPETLDVTDPDELGRLVRDVRPQILVNNAGGGGHIPPHFPDAQREHWQRIITLNLLAPCGSGLRSPRQSPWMPSQPPRSD
jgi:NAD(P)-dependent dehydrogenase (short-subunit alcohol dehydrogenase family)